MDKKRQKSILEVREERLQATTEGSSSAPCLASSSGASFSGKKGCPGIRCILIIKEKKEGSSCQTCYRVWGERKNEDGDSVLRTKRESKGGEEKWQAFLCCRDQRRACRMAQASAKKLEQTKSMEKERVALAPQSGQ